MNKNELCRIKITDIGTHGEGIGKIDGYTLFVKNTIPDEEVNVLVVKANKSYGYGKALEIISPSPHRITPPCAAAGKCGGCTIQHIDYTQQLRLKQNRVKQNLIRIGGFENIEVEPIIGMDDPWHYRNKAQYPVTSDKSGIKAGFYSLGSHKVVECDDCLIGSRSNAEILKAIKAFIEDNGLSAYDEKTGKGLVRHILIREGYYTGEIMVCLVVNSSGFRYKKELVSALKSIKSIKSVIVNYNTVKSNVIMGNRCETLWGSDYITDKIGELEFRISALSFFQVNPVQTYRLYSKALEFADLKGNETVIDAYCGIGTISLFLAQRAKKVYGIEIIPDATKNAEENAKLNNIDNAEFLTGKAEDIVPELYNNGIIPDVMVADPPRKGCDKSLLELMLDMKPRKIVYISCDSATLARDLKILCSTGEYNIEKVQPVDMFPMSYHVETVCQLVLRKPVVHVDIDVDVEELVQDKRGLASYEQIKAYVLEHSGFKVSHLYIAQVKRKCGIIERENYNKPKSEDARQPQCPPEKEAAIRAALEHFGMI